MVEADEGKTMKCLMNEERTIFLLLNQDFEAIQQTLKIK
jgi:hypothetical protein